MRKISENKSIKGKIAVIIFLVVGIVFMFVGLPLYGKDAYNFYELFGSQLLPIGAVITSCAVIGGILVFIPRERIISRSIAFLGVGIIVIVIGIYLSFYNQYVGISIILIGAVIAVLAVISGIVVFFLSKSENSKKSRILRVMSIIGSILCFVGGIAYISAGVIYNNSDDGNMIAMSNSIYVIIAGVFIIIGALSGLKYQIGGSLLCLIIGLIYLIMGFQILKN